MSLVSVADLLEELSGHPAPSYPHDLHPVSRLFTGDGCGVQQRRPSHCGSFEGASRVTLGRSWLVFFRPSWLGRLLTVRRPLSGPAKAPLAFCQLVLMRD